jgi:hypothetical protein
MSDTNNTSGENIRVHNPGAPGVDVAELVRRTLTVFCQEGKRYEVRTLLGKGSAESCLVQYPEGVGDLVAFALRHELAGHPVYFMPNPIQMGELRYRDKDGNEKITGSAHDEHILWRHWLLIDADPRRPTDTMATEVEKAAARAAIDQILPWLASRGIGDVIVGDSGNGYHLLVPIDMPNDEASREACQAFLHDLDARFGSDKVKIDRVVYNAARITRLYGTMNIKGANTPERPHRRSALLEVSNERA